MPYYVGLPQRLGKLEKKQADVRTKKTIAGDIPDYSYKWVGNRHPPKKMKRTPMRYVRANKRPESSPKARKSFWEQPWVIPTATAISTAILSGIISWRVLVYQLSSEHSFASQQKEEERRQKLMDEKVRLTGEATRLLGQMLGIERNFLLDSDEMNVLLKTVEQNDLSKKEFEEFVTSAREDLVRFNSTKAEVESALKICSLHFAPKVQDAIRKLGIAKRDPRAVFNGASESSDEETRRQAVLKAEDGYEDSVYAVIDMMASEIASDFTNASK